MAGPSTSTMSPRSSSFSSAKSSPRSRAEQKSWISPLPSRSFTKTSLPVSRSAITRPATR